MPPLVGLSAEKYNRCLKLVSVYEAEARRCRKVRAYYAGCAMIGAALEAALFAMCDLHLSEMVLILPSLPPDKKPKGPLSRWTLDSLIVVAKAMGWLPTRSKLKANIRIGDAVEFVRRMRNLVHPMAHLRHYPRRTLGRAAYTNAHDIFGAAMSWLEDRVITDLKRDLGIT